MKRSAPNLDRLPPHSASYLVWYFTTYTHDELRHNNFWLLIGGVLPIEKPLGLSCGKAGNDEKASAWLVAIASDEKKKQGEEPCYQIPHPLS